MHCRTIQDFEFQLSLFGLIVAGISVICSVLQQVLVRKILKENQLTSNQLLAMFSQWQTGFLLCIGPFLDRLISGVWVSMAYFTQCTARVLPMSCALAVVVNASQFSCLGKFTAVTFQVSSKLETF